MSILFSALLWLLLTPLGLLVSLIPRKTELRLGRALGRIVLGLGGFRRKIAFENISRCFPELGPEGWQTLLERNFEHYGILVFEFLHFFSPFPAHYHDYAKRVSKLENFELWKKAHDKGKGVLFVTCHVGPWELMAAAGGMAGFIPTIVTTVVKPRWLHDKLTAGRRSCAVSAAYHPGSIPAILKALRRKESVGLMHDQYAHPPMGRAVPFFGVKVNTLAAVAPLAQRTGAAIVPISCYRDPDGIARIVVEPELELGEVLADTEKTTGILAAKVESWVRRHPDQWLWIHRRFKNVVWAQSQRKENSNAGLLQKA